VIEQVRRKEKAIKHIWLRPVTRGRIRRVQDRLQALYQDGFYRLRLGEITMSDTVDWLIYQSGIPGDRGEAVAFVDNIWTEFFKHQVNEVIKED
jgi:hypothetical protein